MTPKRAIDLQIHFVQQLVDIYSAALSFKSTHCTILDNIKDRIYSKSEYQRLPRYAKQYISGYHHALGREFHLNNLEWYMMWRGNLTLSKDILPNTWNEIESDKSRHCYIGRPDRPY